jgi:asparagine synthase (glutamine-hydrolysing)
MLPEEVAWRQKEQFSDGVGYSLLDTLKEMTDKAITDKQFAIIGNRFPINTPSTKEAGYY